MDRTEGMEPERMDGTDALLPEPACRSSASFPCAWCCTSCVTCLARASAATWPDFEVAVVTQRPEKTS